MVSGAEVYENLAEIARDNAWSYEEYLAAVMGRQLSANVANSIKTKIKAAKFNLEKTLEDFFFDHQPSAPRELICHLATSTFVTEADSQDRLAAELKRIRKYKLIIIDEVGYIPFDADTANLFFQLISSRYEQGSVIVTSNHRPIHTSRQGHRTQRNQLPHTKGHQEIHTSWTLEDFSPGAIGNFLIRRKWLLIQSA